MALAPRSAQTLVRRTVETVLASAPAGSSSSRLPSSGHRLDNFAA